MTETFSLQNKLALITGGGSGLGLGIATAFVQAGARVILTGRREALLRKAVSGLGPKAKYVINDVTDSSSHRDLLQQIESDHGPLDILVNNAGRHLKKEALKTSDDEFFEVLNTNLLSVFSLTRSCTNMMRERKRGCVLMISSMSAFIGMEKVVAYSVSKTALTGLIRSLVAEVSKSNIRVNAIAPGWIETKMFNEAINGDPDRKKRITQRIAMSHFGSPEDIGNAAVFMCSDAAKYITGVILPVDGGAATNF